MTTTLAAPQEQTGLQKQQQQVRGLIEKMRPELEKALPRLITPDFFTRVFLTSVNKSPKLLNCTPQSLLACAMDCAQLGLVPDGRRAHLIPYKDKCTLIIDFKGLVELAINSGEVSHVYADKVCKQDDFEFDRGEVTKHKINFSEERGAAYAYYVIVTMKDGSRRAECMSKAEVDAIRKRSKSPNEGPWATDYDEMGKKTVFRRCSKWLKLSPELRERIEKDDEFEEPVVRRPSIVDLPAPEGDGDAKPATEKKTFLKKPEKQVDPAPPTPEPVNEPETKPAAEAESSTPAERPAETEAEIPELQPEEVEAMLLEICADYDLDPKKAESWLAAKGQLKKGQTLKDLASAKVAEIKKNPAKWVNNVRGVAKGDMFTQD